MNAILRRTLVGTTAVSLALALAACGSSDGSPSASATGAKTIGLLLPEKASSNRYEAFDKPLITDSIMGLCSRCSVDYANANGEESTQKEQFEALLTKGVKVILLDPVNAKNTAAWVDEANRQGAKVIAYDRLAAGNVAAYVSFDNERTGELQGTALTDAIGPKAKDAQIVMINGAEADPNAAAFKAGAHQTLDGKVKAIGYEQSGEWQPTLAAQKMNEAIRSLGKDNIQGVYSANDGMAAAIVDAMHAAGMKNVPIGGQDASLDAIKRILTGDQSYTIYKPYKPEADAAADIAVYLLKGLDVASVARGNIQSGDQQIPSMLLTPIVVTKQNVASTIVGGGLYKAADICTPEVAAACQDAGVH
ncbi:ABC transporter substrate-binding protein [Kitasatospora sp. MMS16-BH015]|uniref:sugar ABC transporter substrate-binding protein n=1 Tax=Kitasatospora sp. MMS16-BH015 TaxID=2018025 RepID=UPI000CA36C0A|nr:substrate-binding domain-containing protein [Kitasatospora sp. MMS16-BH015]AUG80726.1 ABC transporter substrate-binding protein [Kitasatospora sp. MMS16-BH015]